MSKLGTLLLLSAGLLLALALSAGAAAIQHAGPDTYARTPGELIPYRGSVPPYRSFYTSPPEFRGPGRDRPEPGGLTAVRVGLLAPLQGPEEETGQSLLRGAMLALDEANALGGYHGLPFELVSRNDQALWGSSGNTLVRFAYEDRVWAIIGSPDSNSTHVALRAAFKAELAIVNVGGSDPTLTETGVPWILRSTPDDRQTGYRLALLLFEEMALSRVAVLRASDRYGRMGVQEFRDGARRLRRPLPMEILFDPGAQDFGPQLERVETSGIEAVVIWGQAPDAALIVRQMRQRGMTQPVFGPDRLASPAFLELAGTAAEGVVATAWMAPERQDERWSAFRRRFVARYQAQPDAFAAYAYDATDLLVDSIRRAGLNRARIRDALARIREWPGVSGTLRFDATSNNVAPLSLVQASGGRFVPLQPLPGAAASATLPLRVGVLETDPDTGDRLVAGARAAAAKVNAAGGLAGRPLEIVRIAAAGPWRDGASVVAGALLDPALVALVGPLDGAGAHMAAQVATRRRVPVVSLSPEDSLTSAGDPWVFRGVPSDREQATAALAAAWADPRGKSAALLVPGGREGRERAAALQRACAAAGIRVAQVIRLEPEPAHDADGAVNAGGPALVIDPAADALLLWLDPEPAARLLRAMAALPGSPPVMASIRLADPELLERLGYDMVSAIAQAARRSGPSAAGIREGLASLPPLAGRTGTFSFDARGNRQGPFVFTSPQPPGDHGTTGDAPADS